MSDIQKNILSGGKEGVSAADALKARSEAYQAGKSRGFGRLLWDICTLGINELWRLGRYNSYESDKAKIVQCAKDVYKALEPKLSGETSKIVLKEAEGYNDEESALYAKPNIGNSMNNAKLIGGTATIERFPSGSGKVTVGDETINIPDCDVVRRNLEMEFMREARRFGKDFVNGILAGYREKMHADHRGSAGDIHFASDDTRQKMAMRHGQAALKVMTAKTNADYDAIEARTQDQTEISSSRSRLKDMLGAFYSAQLDLPEEVGRTMDIDLGISLVGKVLDGEIEDGKKLQAFLDKGSKGVHLTTAESQKVSHEFEKAVAKGDADIQKVKIGENILAPKKPRPTLPQGEIKKLHDFVADLVMNEDNSDYDKTLVGGKTNGARLRELVSANRDLVASLMEKKGEELDNALKTLQPKMAKALKESVLEPLEAKYQKYLESQKGERFVYPRKDWLERSITDSQKSAAKLRIALGVRSQDELSDVAIDALTMNKEVRDDLEQGGADIKGEMFLSDEKGREQLALGLDFFGEMEKKVDRAVTDALADVQKTLSDKLDTIFGKDTSAKVGKTADQLGQMSLEEMKNAYSKDPSLTLIKTTLRNYFKDIGVVQQRQMLAAQTRFCAEVPGKTTEGARFGALLKGAGPVMQKMLQGIDASKINDDDFKLALDDMKDNLAPIPEKAIKAALFSLVKNSADPKIESIEVKSSLGQASVGQALLCTVKCEGMEAQDCVVKILRPNAALAAEREYGIFMAACGNDASMKATFQGRFDSIKEELDLTLEAENMKKADKTYSYDKNIPEIGTFTNTTSAKLFQGVKPTSTVMMQQKAEGTTVKKFIEETKDRLAEENANIPPEELQAMKEKLEKTHSALVSTSYMWANEGLFGSGFYHGDLHAGNLMVDASGKVTMIDFGNATQLDKDGRTNVTRVITGAAVGNVDIFLKGFTALLGETGKANYTAKEAEIKAKIGKVFEKQGLADTALRMSVVLNILQLDYKIEVPGAVHNFLESQKRLAATMDETAALLDAVNGKLGIENAPKPKSMMQCLVQVVKNNISLNLLKTIGLSNAKGMMNTIKQDPLFKKDAPAPAGDGAPGGNAGNEGQVVIQV